MGEIAFNRYGIYKNLPSAISAVCLVINRIGLEDAFNPEKKQNRKFTKSDTFKVFEYLDMMIGYQEPEHLLPDSSITFGEDSDEPSDDFSGFIVPQRGRKSIEKADIKINKHKSDDVFRLCVTMSARAYQKIFRGSKQVTVYISPETRHMLLYPDEIDGFGSWTVTPQSKKFKFTLPLTKDNSSTLTRFIGLYNLNELVFEKFPYPGDNTVKAWSFVPKA